MLSHISALGSLYASSTTPRVPQPKDSCLLSFPNYVTGFLMGVECSYASRKQVKQLLKLAHAERFYVTPPPRVLTPEATTNLLRISLSTLSSWVSKGWIYRWYTRHGLSVFSETEVQALRLARPRSL